MDASDKVCVITGASSGIGAEAALGLARAGFRVVMVCRDRRRGKVARARMNGHTPKVLWLTGLSGSGKSTLADALEQSLHAQIGRAHV